MTKKRKTSASESERRIRELAKSLRAPVTVKTEKIRSEKKTVATTQTYSNFNPPHVGRDAIKILVMALIIVGVQVALRLTRF